MRIRSYLPSLAIPASFSVAPKSCTQKRTVVSPPVAIVGTFRQCAPVAGLLALHPVSPWKTRLDIYPHIDRLETACFGLGLFDNASRGNCSRQRPFLQYSLRSQDFPVKIPEDASQTPEIVPRDGESLSKLQSSSCVGFDRLDHDAPRKSNRVRLRRGNAARSCRVNFLLCPQGRVRWAECFLGGTNR